MGTKVPSSPPRWYARGTQKGRDRGRSGSRRRGRSPGIARKCSARLGVSRFWKLLIIRWSLVRIQAGPSNVTKSPRLGLATRVICGGAASTEQSVPPRCTPGMSPRRKPASKPRRPLRTLRVSANQLSQERRIVELSPIRQDVRVGVGGQAELALADKASDLCPRSSLPMQQRDAAVAEVVRGEDRKCRQPCSHARSQRGADQRPLRGRGAPSGHGLRAAVASPRSPQRVCPAARPRAQSATRSADGRARERARWRARANWPEA